MPHSYLRMITHSAIKIDLNNPPQDYTGISAKMPGMGGVLVIARSKEKLLCLYTMSQINTDYLIPYFDIFTTDYDMTYILPKKNSSGNENAYLDFCKRLSFSLDKFKRLKYKSEKKIYFDSSMIGIHFDGTYAKLETFELITTDMFHSARFAINFFNFFSSRQPSSEYFDYKLDLQFDGSRTQVPKLTEKGYLLWNILENKNRMFLNSSPYIHDDVKELMIFESEGNQVLLNYYSDYIKLVKHHGAKFIKTCTDKFKIGKFGESVTYAEYAIKNFSLLNELHVLDEVSLSYYNLGSTLLQEKLFSEAKNALEKSKELTKRIEQPERLRKIEEKLLIIKENRKPPLFELPTEILFKVLENLSISDIPNLACASSYSAQIMRDGLFWQKKLFKDYTKNVLPETEGTFQKQYKDKYKLISKNSPSKTQLLNDAIKTGAEVLFEKLLLENVQIPENYKTILEIIESQNPKIFDLAFKYGLSVNTRLNAGNNFDVSIFHVVIFKKPDLLPKILNIQRDIHILPSIHIAVISNNMKELKKSVNDIKDIDQEDLCGLTALWWAIFLDRIQMANFLLKNKANYKKLLKTKELYVVLGTHLFENIISQNKKAALELLLKEGLSQNHFIAMPSSCRNLLSIAAKYGSIDIIRLLQTYRAINVNNSEFEGENELKISEDANLISRMYPSAFGVAAEENQVDCLKLFLETGTQVNDLCVVENFHGTNVYILHYTALFFAVTRLNENSVEFLLAHGADPNIAGNTVWYKNKIPCKKEEKLALNQLNSVLENRDFNFTQSNYPSQNPTIKSWFKILELLLTHNADLNKSQFLISLMTTNMVFRIQKSSNHAEREPMGNAISRQNFIIHVFEIISKHKVDFNIQDKKGKSVLHYAAEQGLLLVVTYLIDKNKVNINIKDNDGETAIFGAARNLHENVYSYLKKSNIDTEPNINEETPEKIASSACQMRYK